MTVHYGSTQILDRKRKKSVAWVVNKPRASEKDFSKERSAAWGGKAGRGSSGKEMLFFPLPLLRSGGMNLHAHKAPRLEHFSIHSLGKARF